MSEEAGRKTTSEETALTGHPPEAQCERHERRIEALQEALVRNQAERDAFVYRVSHDLKAPVVALNGMASILLEEYGERLEEQGKFYLQRLMVNAGLLERLLGDLLAYSRIGRKEPVLERFRPEEVIQKVMAEHADTVSRKGIGIELQSPLPEVSFDRGEFEQIFSNLLSNAILFVGDRSHPRIEIGGREEGARIEFYVKDNGIGIAPEYHDVIFGIFERLKEIETEGTGMGLALVKKIVDLADGKIWVESKKGEGAAFFLSLPKRL